MIKTLMPTEHLTATQRALVGAPITVSTESSGTLTGVLAGWAPGRLAVINFTDGRHYLSADLHADRRARDLRAAVRRTVTR